MLAAGESLSESYPATAESVTHGRAAIAEFAERAGARGERLDAIRLSASEALTNAVVHAYDGLGDDSIDVSASCLEDEIWLLIADTGSGLHARSKRPGLGLGLALIAQLADDFKIQSRSSGGTELQMRFKMRSPRRFTDRPEVQLRGSFSSAASAA